MSIRSSKAAEIIGRKGVTVFDPMDAKAMATRDELLLGFAGESPRARALVAIATSMLEASETYDDDICAIEVAGSDVVDLGMMVTDITSAKTLDDLREVLNVYKDVPGATDLAQACADEIRIRMKKVRVG